MIKEIEAAKMLREKSTKKAERFLANIDKQNPYMRSQEFDPDIMEGKILYSRMWGCQRDFVLEFEDDEMSYSFSPTEIGEGGARIIAVEGEHEDCYSQEVESAALMFRFGRQDGESTDTATLIISFGDSEVVVIWERDAQDDMSHFVKFTVA
jgi:hypothetical protein